MAGAMPFSPLGGFPTVATVVVFTDMSTSGFVFWGSKPRARVAASREMAGTVTVTISMFRLLLTVVVSLVSSITLRTYGDLSCGTPEQLRAGSYYLSYDDVILTSWMSRFGLSRAFTDSLS